MDTHRLTASRPKGRLRRTRDRLRRLALGRGRTLWHPAQFGVAAPTALTLVGTVLLMLPVAARSGRSDPSTALFTSASTVSLTGFAVVDTGTYWSPFGQAVLLLLMEVAGLGVMVFASLLGLLVMGRLGLRSRLTPWTDTTTINSQQIMVVIVGVVRIALAVQAAAWATLTARLWLRYDIPFGRAVYEGLFHAVSAFTNAGISLWPGDPIPYTDDPLILLPLAITLVVGGLGYPVLHEVFRSRGPQGWSLHTRLSLVVTAILLVLGPIAVIFTEWDNPDTLGALEPAHRALAGWFNAVSSRSAGFAGFDYGEAEPATRFTTIILMIIGVASGSTGGGLKVTTVAVLVLAVHAEARGRDDVEAFGRRISPATVRQALAIGMAATLVLAVATFALLEMTTLDLETALSETTAAFSTVGLSTGVVAQLPGAGQAVLVLLMYLGFVGPITLASIMALRHTRRSYTYPEARPIVG
ncbi:MAG: TrkH family potassium uptake protein [Actinomycetales bacterium]|nr:TrkH family potassium uptake protein [Actinomycetales bacterium]